MPLSEHEQRLLDQIERALYAEDPKFASTVRGVRLRRSAKRRRVQGVALFVLGVALLLLGVIVPVIRLAGVPVISVFGFLVMFSGALLTWIAWTSPAETVDSPSTKTTQHPSLTQRMEERFRRRFDQD